MGETCGIYREDMQDISGENMPEKGHLKDLDIEGRIILK